MNLFCFIQEDDLKAKPGDTLDLFYVFSLFWDKNEGSHWKIYDLESSGRVHKKSKSG